MEVKGKVHKVLPLETISEKFRKRVLVVDDQEKYPQLLPIEFTQDRVDLLDNVNEGDLVTVGINLRGREHKGKFYSNIEGWRISSESSQSPAKSNPTTSQEEAFEAESDNDPLPF